ncbi:MAG: hypothetical protein ACTSSH_10035 [Candidatus Heimdallarchaeota archaeon]
MDELTEIPELKKEQFEKWADEIIAGNSLNDKETLENITESVAEFFNKLFKNYQISFSDLHPDGIFPFAINRLDKKPSYADEEFYDEFYKVENHMRWTYSFVLTKLYRERECLDNTAECPF